MTRSGRTWWTTSALALGGAAVFWVVNAAISLTPVAARYRAALGIDYSAMLVEAGLGGVAVGYAVAYCLIRFFDDVPVAGTIPKAVVLSSGAFLVVTVLVEVPAKFLTSTDDAFHYFLVATAFNVVRILALGVAVGYLADRLAGPARR